MVILDFKKIKKQLYNIYLKYTAKDTIQVKGWEKAHPVNTNQKKPAVVVLIPARSRFQIRTISRDKEGY